MLGQFFFIIKYLMEVAIGVAVFLLKVQPTPLEPVYLRFNNFSLIILLIGLYDSSRFLMEGRGRCVGKGAIWDRSVFYKSSSAATNCAARIAVKGSHWAWDFGRGSTKLTHSTVGDRCCHGLKKILVENYLDIGGLLVIFFIFNFYYLLNWLYFLSHA
jgi:hypothetical protein